MLAQFACVLADIEVQFIWRQQSKKFLFEEQRKKLCLYLRHKKAFDSISCSNSCFKQRAIITTTCLYYFLSPSDIEPRGCIDLEGEGVQVREIGRCEDGRFRFEIIFVHRKRVIIFNKEIQSNLW